MLVMVEMQKMLMLIMVEMHKMLMLQMVEMLQRSSCVFCVLYFVLQSLPFKDQTDR